MKKYLPISFALIFVGLVGYGAIVAAFTGPTQNPPGGDGALKIGATGNVGIGLGAANPTSKLTVAGTVESTSGGIKFPDATVQTTASPWAAVGSNISNTNAGNVGIGVAAPAQKLDINGDIKTAGQIYGGGSVSSYGALSINGVKNSWSGINFRNGATNFGTYMAYNDGAGNYYSGFMKPTDTAWDWEWVNGSLYQGTVPASHVTGLGDSGVLGAPDYRQAYINTGYGTVYCINGKKVVGGGCTNDWAGGGVNVGQGKCQLTTSGPVVVGSGGSGALINGWSCDWRYNSAYCGGSAAQQVYAICL